MVMPGTGELQQLEPDVEQIVDGESQARSRPGSPLIEIVPQEKRTVPPPTAPRPPLPEAAVVEEQQIAQQIYGTPRLVWNRIAVTKTEFQELIRWDIPVGFTGDLHEISLVSDNDEKTRWKVVIGNEDQNVPGDRQLSTPITWPWNRTVIPGGTAVWVEVLSVDGTAINVDGSLSGTIR